MMARNMWFSPPTRCIVSPQNWVDVQAIVFRSWDSTTIGGFVGHPTFRVQLGCWASGRCSYYSYLQSRCSLFPSISSHMQKTWITWIFPVPMCLEALDGSHGHHLQSRDVGRGAWWFQWLLGSMSEVYGSWVGLKQVHKPSSNQHFYRWYVYHSQTGLSMSLLFYLHWFGTALFTAKKAALR